MYACLIAATHGMFPNPRFIASFGTHLRFLYRYVCPRENMPTKSNIEWLPKGALATFAVPQKKSFPAVNVRMCVYTYVCMFVCMTYVCMYVCMHVCMCA